MLKQAYCTARAHMDLIGAILAMALVAYIAFVHEPVNKKSFTGHVERHNPALFLAPR